MIRQPDSSTNPALAASHKETNLDTPSPPVQKGIHIFISYARRDQRLREQLENHLSNLKYRGLITTWTANEIGVGEEVLQHIDIHLNTAHIILLLISVHFLASERCYGREMIRAVQRHKRGEASVIPVLLRPVVFTDAPFAELQLLPTNGRPVIDWRNRDSAFVDIAIGIERAVQKHLAPSPQSSPWSPSTGATRGGSEELTGATRGGSEEFPTWPNQDDSEEIPTEAIRGGLEEFPITEAGPYRSTGGLVPFSPGGSLQESEEAQRRERERTYYEQALIAYEQALFQNSTDATAYRGKGNALAGLARYDEALAAYEQAIALAPLPATFVSKGHVLTTLGRYDNAVVAYKQALALDVSYVPAYVGLAEALSQLGRTQEAEQSFQCAKQLGDDD